MKKLVWLLISALLLTGCGSTSSENSAEETETTTEYGARDAVDYSNPEKVFKDGDFTIYGEDGLAIVGLGMDKDSVETRLKSFGDNFGDFNVKYSDHIVAKENEDAETETLVQYVSFEGVRNPVYTSKGVYTTGTYGNSANCSTPEQVVDAYDIDTDKESYIVNKNDDNNYCIELLYDDKDERIISPKDTDLSSVEYRKKIRFLITDGVVRTVDLYQNGWE